MIKLADIPHAAELVAKRKKFLDAKASMDTLHYRRDADQQPTLAVAAHVITIDRVTAVKFIDAEVESIDLQLTGLGVAVK